AAASVCAAVRTALALRPEAAALGVRELALSFVLGAGFDLVAALYAVAPFALWLALAPDRVARSRIYRSAMLAGFCAGVFATFLLAVSEWLFWEEFSARFNFIAVDYLLYTHEVLANIWQSYPTGRLLAALALAALALTALLARWLWSWS